jgi:23S rRNA (cytosine1962-C5)-methyltransferase
MQPIYLERMEDRRIRRGHPWVYRNEIDHERSRLEKIEPGAAVRVCDARGVAIGCGYLSPTSRIAVRLLARGAELPDDLIERRLASALAWRERLYRLPFYRWVFAEGDALPGLVVDRYGDACVVQTSTAGMERVLPSILAAIDKLVSPTTLVVKNDATTRKAEELPTYVSLERGNPEVLVPERGAWFSTSLTEGQKTGWFFDQRDNRARFPELVESATVLDLYSYVGAWGVLAAVAGATAVTCVDSSDWAVERTRANAERNGVADRVTARRGDVLDVLTGDVATYDRVVLDPPSLYRRRQDEKRATELYRRLNRAAIERVTPGGLLVTCSCSALLDEAAHLAIVRSAGRQARRHLTLVGRGTAPPDHPQHPFLPETAYLKCAFVRVDGAV